MRKREQTTLEINRLTDAIVFLIFADVADVQIPHLQDFIRRHHAFTNPPLKPLPLGRGCKRRKTLLKK